MFGHDSFYSSISLWNTPIADVGWGGAPCHIAPLHRCSLRHIWVLGTVVLIINSQHLAQQPILWDTLTARKCPWESHQLHFQTSSWGPGAAWGQTQLSKHSCLPVCVLMSTRRNKFSSKLKGLTSPQCQVSVQKGLGFSAPIHSLNHEKTVLSPCPSLES